VFDGYKVAGFEWENQCVGLSGNKLCQPRKELMYLDMDILKLHDVAGTHGRGKINCPEENAEIVNCNASQDFYGRGNPDLSEDWCNSQIMDALMESGILLDTTGAKLTTYEAENREFFSRHRCNDEIAFDGYPCYIYKTEDSTRAKYKWDEHKHNYSCAVHVNEDGQPTPMLSVLDENLSICEMVSEEPTCGDYEVSGKDVDPLMLTHPKTAQGVHISTNPSKMALFPSRCTTWGEWNGMKCKFSNGNDFTDNKQWDGVANYTCESAEDMSCESMPIWDARNKYDGLFGVEFKFFGEGASRGCDMIKGCVGSGGDSEPGCLTFTNPDQFKFKSIFFKSNFSKSSMVMPNMTVEDRAVSLGELSTKCAEINMVPDLKFYNFEDQRWNESDEIFDSPICVENSDLSEPTVVTPESCKIFAAIQNKTFVESACAEGVCSPECVGGDLVDRQCDEEKADIFFCTS
jgi:hypothetical protein